MVNNSININKSKNHLSPQHIEHLMQKLKTCYICLHPHKQYYRAWVAERVGQLDYLTTHTSLSPIRHGFAPGFVNYKKGCTRLAATNDKVYQLLAHGQWFSLGTPASSTTKTGRHDIAEIWLKVALNTKNQSNQIVLH